MNSYCWSMWLIDGEQEIACWRDRLSLSVELTAELEQYQGVWATAEMTKIEWYSLWIHLSFSMEGQYQQTKRRKQAWMSVRRGCLAFGTLVNGICANTMVDSQTTPFLSFHSLGKNDILGALKPLLKYTRKVQWHSLYRSVLCCLY